MRIPDPKRPNEQILYKNWNDNLMRKWTFKISNSKIGIMFNVIYMYIDTIMIIFTCVHHYSNMKTLKWNSKNIQYVNFYKNAFSVSIIKQILFAIWYSVAFISCVFDGTESQTDFHTSKNCQFLTETSTLIECDKST